MRGAMVRKVRLAALEAALVAAITVAPAVAGQPRVTVLEGFYHPT